MINSIANLATLELVSIQYEITRSLNANTDIRSLCRRYMETCIRRLSVRAAYLYMPTKMTGDLFTPNEMTCNHLGRICMPNVTACYPEQVPEIKDFFTKLLNEPSIDNVITQHVVHHGTYYHLFAFIDHTFFVLERCDIPLPPQVINAITPAVKDLFYVCRASLQHSRVVSEVERRKLAEQQLTFIAFHDELTGLPNRTQVINVLNQQIELCVQHDRHGALIYIDLDHFRDINDSLGHIVGDELLCQVAQRLQQICLKQEMVGRFSGNAFVILCPNQLNLQKDLDLLLLKVHQCFELDYQIDGRRIDVNASIGITYFSSASCDAYTVYLQADLAMSKAKISTGTSSVFYQQDMEKQTRRRYLLDTEMRQALIQNDFFMVAQPQVNQYGEIIGAELLIRWQHAELGFIPPDEFITIAEKTGFIIPLGEWIFEQACLCIQTLQTLPLKMPIKLAINVSAKQFYQAEFIDRISTLISQHHIKVSDIELELTESAMLEDIDLAVSKITALKQIGFELSIDDFGTGYSSLSYLKHLPVDKIKIDRSFVSLIDKRDDSRAIVEATMLIARTFKLELIAEGVETEAEVDTLTAMGCCAFQGYFFHKPMAIKDFFSLLCE
ncbi:putative bifunctional diguanylate cyclase/phosphodiesterase [Shewanella sp. MF05960]|uniref:putative bifunctional diguanylate cyclase/phosphodiesterase n=1 Tax=Shewanella sp. MF05960 TaxID=3434874 RepID=UPI003D7B168A